MLCFITVFVKYLNQTNNNNKTIKNNKTKKIIITLVKIKMKQNNNNNNNKFLTPGIFTTGGIKNKLK